MFFKKKSPLELISSADTNERIKAVKKTYLDNDQTAFEIFQKAIVDSDKKVRHNAASLYLVEHPELIDHCNKEQLFEDSLYFFEREKSKNAFKVLKLLNDPRSIPAIIACLKSTSILAPAEREMIIFLGEHGNQSHGEFILSLCDKQVFDFKDSVEVIYSSLVRTYNDKVISALIHTVNLQRASDKDSAALFAESLTFAGSVTKFELIERLWSAITLGKIGGERAFELLMTGIDPKTNCHKVVKRGCALGLYYTKDSRAVDKLIDAISISTKSDAKFGQFDATFGQFCSFALMNIGEPSVQPIIRECQIQIPNVNRLFILVLVLINSDSSRNFIQQLKNSSHKKLIDDIVKIETDAKEFKMPENFSVATN
ncbi:MAG: hypothetical protein A2V93_12005 [Ignavibacteria bacterium RBG_16_34_14]|nr:MAG: hypothetical protein A2V93_12005 [Ignavibacteria bacterium RBG_16_34_14]